MSSNMSLIDTLHQVAPNHKELASLLVLLKERNDVFHHTYDELRSDFLMRGICAKEVDGLLADHLQFPDTWLPAHLRWHALLHAQGQQLSSLLTEAKAYLPFTGEVLFQEEIAQKLLHAIDVYV